MTNRHLGIFFALAYGLSWVLWIPAALLDAETMQSWMILLYLIGGFGPTIAGLIVIGRTQDRQGQREFLRRVVSFRRIRGGWYLFIVAVFPILAVLSVLVYRLIYGSLPSLPALEGITAQQLVVVLPVLAIQILIAGPLSEELGWRGFALDGFQQRWSPLVSSLLLGLLWSIWHLPLFFIEGSMYADWGFGAGLFWLFLVRMTAISVLMTWVYNSNDRSILSAILMHFAYNFTFGFFHPAPDAIHWYGTLIAVIVVFAVAVRCRSLGYVSYQEDDLAAVR